MTAVPGMSRMRVRFETFAADCGLELEPFQKRIWRAVHGPEREVAISTARGNSKTTIASIVALHYLVSTENAAAYCVAASVPQARILYESAAGFARELDHPNIVYRHHELRWCPPPRAADQLHPPPTGPGRRGAAPARPHADADVPR